ncbi:MAG: hypothetical protein RR540_01220 [Oscillospiraceae bacterium]
MYNTIKLEKGLYNLAGKSFTAALSEQDADEQYADTEMRGLDAFERQLKRFDIKVSGENSDTVDRFFQTTQTAVLFPEFIKRAVKQGMESAVLNEIVAAKSTTSAVDYRGMNVVPEANKPYSTATVSGTAMPETAIGLSTTLVNMVKYGRVISTSYEAIRQQRLDAFAVTLKSIGGQISRAVANAAIGVLKEGLTAKTIVGTTFNYAELVGFWGAFENYDLTTIIASPKTMAQILSFDQMKYSYDDYMATGIIKTPFGATLIKSSTIADDLIIGLDKKYALEMVTSSDVILETDKLIDRQVDRIAISVTTGFSKIISDAVMTLDTTK